MIKKPQPTVLRTQLGCVIVPYRKRQAPSIEEHTGEYDKVYHKYKSYVGFLLPYRGQISYITYNRSYDDLTRAFPGYEIQTAPIIPPRDIRHRLEIQNVESLRQAQSEILDQIHQLMPTKPSWFVNLQTNEGKTLLAICLMVELKYKTWITCFSKEILTQWIDKIQKFTNIDPDRILIMSGSVINKLLAGKLDPSDYDVFISTPLLLDSLARNRTNYGYIGDLFELCGIGFLIYDEAHRMLGNLVKIAACANVKHQIYLSADFAQGSFIRDPIFKNVFHDIPVISPSEDLKRSLMYTKLGIVKYNTRPTEVEKLSINNRYGFSAEYYMDYQFKKGVIFGIMDQVMHNYYFGLEGKYRILILFVNIKHVDDMYTYLHTKYPGVRVGGFYGELPEGEKNDTKYNAEVLVATYGSFSTGLDTENIKYVISCNQCNKVADNQAAGRSRRLADGSDAVYLMLVDYGFEYCKFKIKKRLEYLLETKSKDETVYVTNYNPDMHRGEE